MDAPRALALIPAQSQPDTDAHAASRDSMASRWMSCGAARDLS
jgi:hypothetical protein